MLLWPRALDAGVPPALEHSRGDTRGGEGAPTEHCTTPAPLGVPPKVRGVGQDRGQAVKGVPRAGCPSPTWTDASPPGVPQRGAGGPCSPDLPCLLGSRLCPVASRAVQTPPVPTIGQHARLRPLCSPEAPSQYHRPPSALKQPARGEWGAAQATRGTGCGAGL